MKKDKDQVNPVGRPTYIPDNDTAAQVEMMARLGIPKEQIAKVLGISQDTIYKYYKEELDTSLIKANVTVANTLYRKAVSGDNACMFFWLKTRAGLKETHVIEKVKSDIDPNFIRSIDLDSVDPQTLDAMRNLLLQAEGNMKLIEGKVNEPRD